MIFRRVFGPYARYTVQLFWKARYGFLKLPTRKTAKFDLTVENIVSEHFRKHSKIGHVSEKGLRTALGLLEGHPARILETGTAAWGTLSTQLFDSYANAFGGEVVTIDIRPEPRNELSPKLRRTTFVVGDSVIELKRIVQQLRRSRADQLRTLVYLDSKDVDWFNPVESASHGLDEFNVLASALPTGSLVLIDDSPNAMSMIPSENHEEARRFQAKHGVLPGKGAFVLRDLSPGWQVKMHTYSLLLEKSS